MLVRRIEEDLNRVDVHIATAVEVVVLIHHRVTDGLVIQSVLLSFEYLVINALPDKDSGGSLIGVAAVQQQGPEIIKSLSKARSAVRAERGQEC